MTRCARHRLIEAVAGAALVGLSVWVGYSVGLMAYYLLDGIVLTGGPNQ